MLLLRKDVLINIWMIGRFNEEKLPHESDFYSSLNMEDI